MLPVTDNLSPAEVFAKEFARQLAKPKLIQLSRRDSKAIMAVTVVIALMGSASLVKMASDRAAERSRIDAVVASEFSAETHDQKVARLAAKARAKAASASQMPEAYAMDDLISDIDGLYTSGKIDHADMLALKSTAIAGAALATGDQ